VADTVLPQPPGLPAGVRVTFADEVPDMPQPCTHPDHGPWAHKHVGVGRTWFYKPAPEDGPKDPPDTSWVTEVPGT
jgi:hypothetical protein